MGARACKSGNMGIVQITLTDASYANALRELLERGGVREVRSVEAPTSNSTVNRGGPGCVGQSAIPPRQPRADRPDYQ